MASGSVDVTYRGIFQKTLAGIITKEMVKAARLENKYGGTIQRYGDSPERNGIPAKQYALVTDTLSELHTEMTKYEPDNVKVICAMDDTLAKGVESWAWYGVQPININLSPGGTLLFISHRTPEEFLAFVPRKSFDWTIAVLDGDPSFAGLWVYKDDGTDYRTIGAIAKIAPDLIAIQSLRQYLGTKPRQLAFVEEGYESVKLYPVKAGQGAEDTYVPIEKPGWDEMREGVAINAVPVGQRNQLFKKYTTRSRRPVVDFETCIQCKLCFLECPDEAFDPTPTGHFGVSYESCCGCGICSEVCPVDDCITMVDELLFENNDDLYAEYTRAPEQYKEFISEKIQQAEVKSL